MKAFLFKVLNFLKFFGTLIYNYVCKKRKVINESTVSLDVNADGNDDIKIHIKTELSEQNAQATERDESNQIGGRK